jgi:CheY-like chemotaxis protein
MIKQEKKSKLILVVDDNIQICDIMEEFLKSHGYDTVSVYNGYEAVIAAQKYIPDLILIDFHMPIMDGIEASKQIKNIETTKHIPIIMVTGCLEKKDDAKSIGCFSYEVKPIAPSDIIEKIKAAITTKSFLEKI